MFKCYELIRKTKRYNKQKPMKSKEFLKKPYLVRRQGERFSLWMHHYTQPKYYNREKITIGKNIN